ncbi:MAG: CDP-archaeol synthase [Candidatus Thorarchaeota archaeon]
MTATETLEERDKRNERIAFILALFFVCLLFVNFLVISVFFTWADWVSLLIFSLLLIVPAYLSNASMVITGGGRPIDGGKLFRDGRRILGDHKTVNGLKGPLYVGIPISFMLFLIFIILWQSIKDLVVQALAEGQYLLYNDFKVFQYYFIGGQFPSNFFILLIRIILASYGAVIGDLFGSFLKRRFDIKSGAPFWIVDQLDFALIAILFIAIPSFIFPTVFLLPDIYIFIFLIIITPAVSIIANTVAYIVGLKSVPY